MTVSIKGLWMFPAVLGVLVALTIPARSQEPQVVVVQDIEIDASFCWNCPASERTLTLEISGPTSWKVVAGTCQAVGTPCPPVKTEDKTHQFTAHFQEGVAYNGTMRLQLEAPGTIPTCQGSTPPACPAAGPYVYSPQVYFVGVVSNANCWCI